MIFGINSTSYDRVPATLPASETSTDFSDSGSLSDSIELSDIKPKSKTKKKSKKGRRLLSPDFGSEVDFGDIEENCLFSENRQRNRLNIILVLILFITLSLIALEVKYIKPPPNRDNVYHKQQQNEKQPSPFLAPQDFNLDVNDQKAPWKLNTEEAYKMNKTFSSSSESQVRYYQFNVSQIMAAPDGVYKQLSVINGQFPGPLVECNSGDTLEIEVNNHGDEPTSIHFHGIFQNGTNFYDGSSKINQCDIPVGGKLTYRFKIDDSQWGTYWYHSHFSTQYADGLFGPMVIHSPLEDKLLQEAGQDYDEDRVIIFNDWYHYKADSYLENYLSSGNENTEPTPDNGLIQGDGWFDCSKIEGDCDQSLAGRHVFQFKPNTKYRLRLINAGFFAEIDYSIDNHMLEVIEVEGTNVHNLKLDVLRIAVAQRYSVIVTTDQKSDSNLFYMRAKLNDFCFAEANPNLDLDLKAIISVNEGPVLEPSFPITSTLLPNTSSYGHPNVRCRELNETLLIPLQEEKIPEKDYYFKIDSSFQIKARAISLGYMNDVTYKPIQGNSNSLLESIRAYQASATEDDNNDEHGNEMAMLTKSFGPNNDQFALTVDKPVTVDILINNLDDGSHPFHLHGYKFWVLDFGQGYFKPWRDYGSINDVNPVKRDTVNISGYGWVLIRVTLNNPGIWPLHCHIGWHMEAGLAMQVNVQPDIYKDWSLPEDWLGICSSV